MALTCSGAMALDKPRVSLPEPLCGTQIKTGFGGGDGKAKAKGKGKGKGKRAK